MPVLEALGRLCRGSDGQQLIALLSQYAPTWLVQMPALLSASELSALQAKVRGATQARMLREMAEAVEMLTNERPLLLILEDLHWSDYSTVALLSLLARRREPARLLILGTYRPIEILSNGHPLRGLPQEWQLRGYSHELELEGVSRSAVSEYLSRRFAHNQFPLQLARFVYERT
jgi:predicted ATPase